MTEQTIYRVTVRTTNSVQPISTFWTREVLYCGTDRTEARIAYHASEPEDFGYGYGNPARETLLEILTDEDAPDPVLAEREDIE